MDLGKTQRKGIEAQPIVAPSFVPMPESVPTPAGVPERETVPMKRQD